MKSVTLRPSKPLTLLAGLLLAACGGSDDANADTSGGGGTGAAADAGTGPAAACPEGQMCMSMEEDYCVQDGAQCLDPALVGNCPAGEMCMSMDQDYCVTPGGTCVGARKNYGIDLQVPHAHIFTQVGVVFTVRDLDQCTDPADRTTCLAVPGLPLVGFYQPKGAPAPVTQAIEPGVFDDMGDGTYTWMRSFGEYGAAAVGATFLENGQNYAVAFPLETSKAGGERYFCDLDGDAVPEHAFQIRWNASVGAFKADAQEVVFSFEVMRSFNTPVDQEKPWQNLFDHLRPNELTGEAPTFELMAGEGAAATSLGALVPTYAGKGVYTVRRAFAAADLGGEASKTLWFKVGFADTAGCTVAGGVGDDEANYHFTVSAP